MRWRTFPHSFRLLARAALLLLAASAFGQGQFQFVNYSAPTRIGSLDGPLAGRGIWAQMLVGTEAGSLLPVWTPLEHLGSGIVGNPVVTVPGFPCFSRGYFQMVAWDGNRWGTALADVPLDQLGRTDIVTSGLGCFPAPIYAPPFTQPAIVPVPEPSVVGLAVVGAGLLLWRWRAPVWKGKAGSQLVATVANSSPNLVTYGTGPETKSG